MHAPGAAPGTSLLDVLPDDLLRCVLAKLPADALGAARLACRRVRRCADGDARRITVRSDSAAALLQAARSLPSRRFEALRCFSVTPGGRCATTAPSERVAEVLQAGVLNADNVPCLECLDLTAAALGRATQGGQALASTVRALPPSLTSLLLAENDLRRDGVAALADALLDADVGFRVQRLDLRANGVECPRGAAELARALGAPCASSALRRLDVSCNVFNDRGAQALSDVMMRLTALVRLDMSVTLCGCFTSANASETGNERDRAGERWALAFAPALGVMRCLQRLDVSGNDVGPIGSRILVDALAAQPSPPRLSHLDMRYVDAGPSGASGMAASLAQLTLLERLHLHGNAIGARGAAALAPALASLTRMRCLSLGVNDLGEAGAQALAPALARMTRLTSLDVADNALGAAGTLVLARVVVVALPWLRRLNVSGNRADASCVHALLSALRPRVASGLYLMGSGTDSGTDSGADSVWGNRIAASLRRLAPGLRTLHLGYTSGPLLPVAPVVAPALRAATALTRLVLPSAGIDGEGGRALALALADASGEERALPLRWLDLRANALGPVGAAALASALPRLRQLAVLDLSYNGIAFEGAEALSASSALGACRTLQRLYLQSNAIGPDGLDALSRALPRRLSQLHVDGNRITAAGIAALVRIFNRCDRLRWVSAARNEFKDDGVDATARLIAGLAAASSPPSSSSSSGGGLRLEVLDLADNRFGPDSVCTLRVAAHVLSDAMGVRVFL